MGGMRRGRAEAGVFRGERRADRAQLYAQLSPLHQVCHLTLAGSPHRSSRRT